MSERNDPPYDVIVVGGGNAALCAALTARHVVQRVLLLERAPHGLRGGNSRHTRNIRHCHDGPDEVMTGRYSDDEMWTDLVKVSGSEINEPLARRLIHNSHDCPAFMTEHGVRWQPSLRGTLHLSRTNRFFLGGGKALVNAYYQRAEDMGIEIMYDTQATSLIVDGDRCQGVEVAVDGAHRFFGARAVVVAAGGFEANLDWLSQYWGPAARNFVVRGNPFNDGLMLRVLLDHGARSIGDPKGFHAVAVDARAPDFDGGIVTRLDAIPFGIVVNREARRFADEGEDLWPRRYASWGRLIAEQRDQCAFSIFDTKAFGKFIPGVFPPLVADSIEALATKLALDPATLAATVRTFNTAAPAGGRADFSGLDGRTTAGLDPAKSNWAERIDEPPYFAYPLRTGVTFTYLGVAIDDEARIARSDGSSFPNIFAAGEIMAGNVLTKGYLAGIGLTIGTVFGRIAGAAAARVAAA